MSFLNKLLGKQSAPASQSWPEMVLVPTGPNPMPNDENMSMRGFYIRDVGTHRGISHRELFELVPGSVIFKVAGTSFRPDA